MTNEFAADVLEQYREKPTLINEIQTVEEAAWLDEALGMAISALSVKAIDPEPIIKFIERGLNEGRFGNDVIQVLTEIEYAKPVWLNKSKTDKESAE